MNTAEALNKLKEKGLKTELVSDVPVILRGHLGEDGREEFLINSVGLRYICEALGPHGETQDRRTEQVLLFNAVDWVLHVYGMEMYD